jgi:dTDP-4-amino-4,6-dideoxygalactose transaminase
MLNTPFSPWPSFTAEEAATVSSVLLSNKVNYWTGEECRAFETEFASWSTTRYAVAMANGTLALDVALKALDIGFGDEVVVTPRTFFASAACIVNAGATPVFADVDRNSQNITAETISRVLSPRTKAIICVHLAGMPCYMDEIMALAQAHKLYVIEDCAQAHGARYKGRMVGSIGHVGAWSFCQDKIITTGGEGGMVTTNDKQLWETMWSLKDHGKSWQGVYGRDHPPGFKWVHESFGTNWRMMEIQGAIGRIQLRHIAEWTRQRRTNALRIAEACQNLAAVRVPIVPTDVDHAYYRFYLFAQPEHLRNGWTRDRIVAEIVARGVPCLLGSCPEVYLERAFDYSGLRPRGRLEGAKVLGETSMAFLVHPTLTPEEIDKTCTVVNEVLTMAGPVRD